ncbi:hypothetical protein CAPTEDRAFT_207051 [Capitella teleta]|uniref:G-protein coupled receptors family 1 profile domain-containing protein n=1 Tax=Capitella teleta TaxID=283909 RepID=R7VAS4_CAPTE|nr:hypothetical protein CAPTEDRAFT_207051 [Capitella teleta]|eukprot:ELU15679.1 hypothetical protein CAPTEDRAFT_207051 [Capitella teleta]
MTLTDMTVLLTSALRWVVDALSDVDIADLSTGGCMFYHHVTHVMRGLSAWVLLLVTFERALAIHLLPLGLKTIGKKHLRLSVLGISLALLVANSHWYWNIKQLADLRGSHFACPVFNFSGMNDGWWWFNLSLTDLLPLLLLLIAACPLTAKLSLTIAHRTPVIHSSFRNNFSNFESQVTTLSLALSYFYFLTVLPFTIVYLGRHFWVLSDQHQDLVDSICVLLVLIFSSCKLPLYICIVNKSLLRTALQRKPSERRKKTVKAAVNIEDSEDQMTSKGFSQGSIKSRRKRGLAKDAKRKECEADSDLGGSVSNGTHPHHEACLEEAPQSEEKEDSDAEPAEKKKEDEKEEEVDKGDDETTRWSIESTFTLGSCY